jgi:cell wall-associated NlpC family hydrolase
MQDRESHPSANGQPRPTPLTPPPPRSAPPRQPIPGTEPNSTAGAVPFAEKPLPNPIKAAKNARLNVARSATSKAAAAGVPYAGTAKTALDVKFGKKDGSKVTKKEIAGAAAGLSGAPTGARTSAGGGASGSKSSLASIAGGRQRWAATDDGNSLSSEGRSTPGDTSPTAGSPTAAGQQSEGQPTGPAKSPGQLSPPRKAAGNSGPGGKKGKKGGVGGKAKKAVKLKILAALAAVAGPFALIMVFIVLLIAVVNGVATSSANSQRAAVAVTDGGVPEEVMLAYAEIGNEQGVPWEILAAAAQVSTSHGRGVPGDAVRRTVDVDTAISPVAIPPISAEQGQTVFEGHYLIDPAAVELREDQSLQNIYHSSRAIAGMLRQSTSAHDAYISEVAWTDPSQQEVWLDALRTLPVMGNTPPPPSDPAIGEVCSADNLIIMVGDSLTVGVQNTDTFPDAVFIAEIGWSYKRGVDELFTWLTTPRDEDPSEETDEERTATSPPNLNQVDVSQIQDPNPNGLTEIIIHLGTNGWGTSDPAAMLDSLVDIPHVRLTIVKPRDPTGHPRVSSSPVSDVRRQIDEFIDRWPAAEIRVIDGSTWITDLDADIEPDGIHPTYTGYQKLADSLNTTVCNPSPISLAVPPVPYADRVYATAMSFHGLSPVTTTIFLPGVPPVVLDGYVRAAEWATTQYPNCGMDLAFIAAIGYVESRHSQGVDGMGNVGRSIDSSGTLDPYFFGPATRLVNNLSPADMSFYRHPQGDRLHATGNMQFMPTTWNYIEEHLGVGHAGGRPNPQNVYDAPRGTAHYLCTGARGNVSTDPEAKRRAINAYNPASYYYQLVINAEAELRTQISASQGIFVSSSEGIQRVIEWAHAMQGSPYAAVNPFRFGDVLWDGGRHQSFNNENVWYQFPAGTRVFDCSGFITSAFRQAGFDLVSVNAASTRTMRNNSNLNYVTREQLIPGDVIVYEPSSTGVGHVIIFLGGDDYIHAGGCGGGTSGVCRRSGIDWNRATVFFRVPV